jgi:hypothetical protein
MKRVELHVISLDVLLWALGGFGEPEYTSPRQTWRHDEAALRRMWCEEGLTAPQIGKRLHRTPCAVWAQAMRMGLPRRGNGGRPPWKERIVA